MKVNKISHLTHVFKITAGESHQIPKPVKYPLQKQNQTAGQNIDGSILLFKELKKKKITKR